MDTVVAEQPKSQRLVQYLSGIVTPVVRLRELLFSLRVVSIPALSVAIGFVLYWNVPQSQDLFLEVIGSGWGSVWYWPGWPTLGYWAVFYLIALLAWALPVYLSARWILARYNEWARTTMSDCLFPVADWVARALPPALAALCFAAIMVGQWQATSNAPDSYLCRLESETDSARGVKEQDPDLVKETKDPIPVSASEVSQRPPGGADQTKTNFFLSESDCDRYLQDQNKKTPEAHWVKVPPSPDRPTIEFAQNWLRKGALIPLAALFLTAGVAFRHSRWFFRLPFLILQLACAVAIGWLIYYAIALERDLQDKFSVDAIAILPLVSLAAAWLTWKIFRRHSEKPLEIPTGFMPLGHSLILLAAIIALAAVLFWDPLVIAEQVTYRASLLAAGLGIWVMPLTVLAAGSIRFRFPLVIGFLAILGATNWFVGDNSDIRTLHLDAAPTRPSINDDIDRWKKANNCAKTETDSSPRTCPAPIIVLAAGGASRSAFFAASVLGELMDQSNEAASNPTRKPDDFKNQLFAISGVSGGSVAAVMFEAALADSTSTKSAVARFDPPCRLTKTAKDDKLWFGNYAEESTASSIKESWKNCMQILTAGDFLSPAFVRLVGADALNLRLWYGDRAEALERSWERRYKLITENPTLEESFTRVRQSALDRGNWLPILLLNSTSVSTGRRIIISSDDYLSGSDPKEKTACFGRDTAECGRVFQDSYDLYELFQTHPNNEKHSGGCGACDVRLSTAAAMSARFPVFSPHGTVRNAEGKVADRVVDGGYFENYGAITAQELAERLQRSDLSPIILLITNEPRTPVMACVDNNFTGNRQPLEYPEAGEATTAALVSSPAKALLGTENARGSLDAISLCNRMKNGPDGKPLPGYEGDFWHIGVSRNIKELSMSWWLSKTVQRALDKELEDETNNKSTLSQVTLSLQVDPRAAALSKRGNSNFFSRKYDDAIEDYSKAIAQSPDNADYYDELARAYSAKRGFDNALANHNKAIALSPKNAQYYVNRGSTYYAMRNYDSAVADYANAIELNPNNAPYYVSRGNTYYAMRNYDSAVADYENAIKLNPNNAPYYVSRGNTYYAMRNYDSAVADYTNAIKLNPINAFYYNNRAEAYGQKREYDLAVADYNKAIELNPNNSSFYNNRAFAYEGKGQYDLAFADYSKAIEVSPQCALCYFARARAYEAKGDYDRAIADYSAAIQLNPKFSAAYFGRGRASLYLGALPSALADFDLLSESTPKYAYPALWIDIANKRSNLPSRLAEATNQIDMTKWPAPIIRLYLGQSTPEAVLTAADDPNVDTKKGQVCEANFYSGELALQRDAKQEAAQLFRVAAADCPKSFIEYEGATAELKALGENR